jgi:hypothetical protein
VRPVASRFCATAYPSWLMSQSVSVVLLDHLPASAMLRAMFTSSIRSADLRSKITVPFS